MSTSFRRCSIFLWAFVAALFGFIEVLRPRISNIITSSSNGQVQTKLPNNTLVVESSNSLSLVTSKPIGNGSSQKGINKPLPRTETPAAAAPATANTIEPEKTKNTTKSQEEKKNSSAEKLEEIISKAKSLAGDRHVILQLLSAGYLELTKNWICNVRHFDVLSKVLFIATDRQAAQGILRFNSSLHVVQMPAFEKGRKSFTFYNAEYKWYMDFRTNLVYQMLMSNITVWLVESDAVWMRDPTDRVTSIDGDILVQNDAILPDTQYCGGFQYLRPTKPTQEVWRQVHEIMAENSKKTKYKDLIIGGNEQQHLDAIAHNMTGLKLTFLPQDEFILGKLYNESRDLHPNAIMIHNNFVVGSDEKVRRAKSMGDWFLSDTGTTCNAAHDSFSTLGRRNGTSKRRLTQQLEVISWQ